MLWKQFIAQEIKNPILSRLSTDYWFAGLYTIQFMWRRNIDAGKDGSCRARDVFRVGEVDDASFVRSQCRHYLSGGLRALRANPRGNCSACGRAATRMKPRVNLAISSVGSAISVENLSQVPFKRPLVTPAQIPSASFLVGRHDSAVAARPFRLRIP